jgi:Ser/Thr protein kinase RdoA (MazF antagonist)
MDPRAYPHLLDWWNDNPSDPDRPTLDNPAVQRLVDAIEPGAQATDLGGIMSLNVRLDPAGLVLRVHQPSVSRRRLLAVQAVRRDLIGQGLVVPAPLAWRGATVFRCGPRWAEIERYIVHERAAPTLDSYRWLFGTLGALHRALLPLALPVPRPVIATYAPPGSLRRWLPVTTAAVRDDREATAVARLLAALIGRLRGQWVPACRLPVQLIHGDVRLSNVGRAPDGRAVYLDFGFLARRPRLHDLAYALAFMVRALEGHHAPEAFGWQRVPDLVADYEAAAQARLTAEERRALAPYTAAVPLHGAALDGFATDPAAQLRSRRPFLRLSDWLLAHPDALLG